MSVQSANAISPVTRQLSDYIAATAKRPLPAEVEQKTKDHVLDTLAAILSGSRLGAGVHAAAYVKRLGGTPEATVLGTALVVPAELAALANGMAGHADETDDSHLRGRFHPGCGIVPSALAVGEQRDCGGAEFLRGGHDAAARVEAA